jgi:hypothetical protein
MTTRPIQTKAHLTRIHPNQRSHFRLQTINSQRFNNPHLVKRAEERDVRVVLQVQSQVTRGIQATGRVSQLPSTFKISFPYVRAFVRLQNMFPRLRGDSPMEIMRQNDATPTQEIQKINPNPSKSTKNTQNRV